MNFNSLPNMHSPYGYGNLRKIAVKKISENLIEHPILYNEVHLYSHYCLLPSYILVFYKIQVVSKLARRRKLHFTLKPRRIIFWSGKGQGILKLIFCVNNVSIPGIVS